MNRIGAVLLLTLPIFGMSRAGPEPEAGLPASFLVIELRPEVFREGSVAQTRAKAADFALRLGFPLTDFEDGAASRLLEVTPSRTGGGMLFRARVRLACLGQGLVADVVDVADSGAQYVVFAL